MHVETGCEIVNLIETVVVDYSAHTDEILAFIKVKFFNQLRNSPSEVRPLSCG